MLSIPRLKQAILDELFQRGWINQTGNNSTVYWPELFAEAIATAVVNEIQTNAEVSQSGPHTHGDGSHAHTPGNIK